MPVGRIAGGSASLAWPHSDISFFTFTFILSEPPTPELPVDARAVGGRDEPRGLGDNFGSPCRTSGLHEEAVAHVELICECCHGKGTLNANGWGEEDLDRPAVCGGRYNRQGDRVWARNGRGRHSQTPPRSHCLISPSGTSISRPAASERGTVFEMVTTADYPTITRLATGNNDRMSQQTMLPGCCAKEKYSGTSSQLWEEIPRHSADLSWYVALHPWCTFWACSDMCSELMCTI